MTALVVLALSLPCVYVTPSADGGAALAAAAITRVCTAADLATRQPLATPGTAPRPGLASPTRAPWGVANGRRFLRQPRAKYVYDLPVGKAMLAAAEAFAYAVDAALKIAPDDARSLGEMLKLLAALPPADFPVVSDFAVVDDGSAATGEVMNLLTRRNLLFEVVQSPSPRHRLNIRMHSSLPA